MHMYVCKYDYAYTFMYVFSFCAFSHRIILLSLFWRYQLPTFAPSPPRSASDSALGSLYFVGHLLRSLNSLTLTHTGRHKQRGTRRRRRIVAAAAALRRLLQFVVDSLCVWTRLCLCLAHIVLALPLPMPLPVSPFNGCVCFEYI